MPFGRASRRCILVFPASRSPLSQISLGAPRLHTSRHHFHLLLRRRLRAAVDGNRRTTRLLLNKAHIEIWNVLNTSVAVDATRDQWRRIDIMRRVAGRRVLPVLSRSHAQLARVSGDFYALLEVACAVQVLRCIASELPTRAQVEYIELRIQIIDADLLNASVLKVVLFSWLQDRLRVELPRILASQAVNHAAVLAVVLDS